MFDCENERLRRIQTLTTHSFPTICWTKHCIWICFTSMVAILRKIFVRVLERVKTCEKSSCILGRPKYCTCFMFICSKNEFSLGRACMVTFCNHLASGGGWVFVAMGSKRVSWAVEAWFAVTIPVLTRSQKTHTKGLHETHNHNFPFKSRTYSHNWLQLCGLFRLLYTKLP